VLDFHVHLLPAVDDGPATVEASSALLQCLAEQGVTEAVATPHQFSTRVPVDDGAVDRAWGVAQEMASANGIRLHLGAENHFNGIIQADRFAARATPLGTSSCVLVELPDDHLPSGTWSACFALQTMRRRPIIAHPERCKGLHRSDARLAEYVASGGLLQLTAGHLSGKHGWVMRWRSRRLLARFPRACVIASDGHDLKARRPAFDRLPPAFRPWLCPTLAALRDWNGPVATR
jgi:protein-tyrosine phosphatase